MVLAVGQVARPVVANSSAFVASASRPSRAPRRRRAPVVGKRTELARYTVTEGERILYGQRIDGIVGVTYRPANQGGRAYLVERELETKSELDALIADYLLCRVRYRTYYAEALDMPS